MNPMELEARIQFAQSLAQQYPRPEEFLPETAGPFPAIGASRALAALDEYLETEGLGTQTHAAADAAKSLRDRLRYWWTQGTENALRNALNSIDADSQRAMLPFGERFAPGRLEIMPDEPYEDPPAPRPLVVLVEVGGALVVTSTTPVQIVFLEDVTDEDEINAEGLVTYGGDEYTVETHESRGGIPSSVYRQLAELLGR